MAAGLVTAYVNVVRGWVTGLVVLYSGRDDAYALLPLPPSS
jgi:hypothetical protein